MTEEPAATSASTDGWITLDDLPQGALFETQRGTVAVKSEYRYPSGQWECTLLASGEYAHFANGNAEQVREIHVDCLKADLARVTAELDEANVLLRNNQVRREEVETRHGDLLRERHALRAALLDCVTEIQEFMAGTTLLSWSVPPARVALARLDSASGQGEDETC